MTSLFETSAALRQAWPSAHAFPCTSLSFISCYVYSPRAAGATAEASRLLCARVKASDPVWLPRYAGSVYRASTRDSELAALFGCSAMLVPVPGSSISAGGPWAAERLAAALGMVGLGQRVWPALRRQLALRKSATSPAGARPSVREHYESFAIARGPVAAAKIVLVDDVITKGRTLLAAAARLQAEWPHADIRAFALIRTVGFVPRMTQLLELCHGVVRWAGGDARREP
jgi:predicted amidophosphoribosyltransferase